MKNKKKTKAFQLQFTGTEKVVGRNDGYGKKERFTGRFKGSQKEKTTFKLQFQGRNKDLWEEINPSNYGLREEIKVYMKKYKFFILWFTG